MCLPWVLSLQINETTPELRVCSGRHEEAFAFIMQHHRHLAPVALAPAACPSLNRISGIESLSTSMVRHVVYCELP
jgi:hypothetical protein